VGKRGETTPRSCALLLQTCLETSHSWAPCRNWPHLRSLPAFHCRRRRSSRSRKGSHSSRTGSSRRSSRRSSSRSRMRRRLMRFRSHSGRPQRRRQRRCLTNQSWRPWYGKELQYQDRVLLAMKARPTSQSRRPCWAATLYTGINGMVFTSNPPWLHSCQPIMQANVL
jgi:hypothetical protein